MGLELEMEWTLKRYNTNNDLDPALPPHDRSWDTVGIGAKDGVDFKLMWKSYNPNMDLELDPDMELNPSQQLTSVWYSCGDKTLEGSSYKKCTNGTSATYICHTHEKVLKKQTEFTAENGIDQ